MGFNCIICLDKFENGGITCTSRSLTDDHLQNEFSEDSLHYICVDDFNKYLSYDFLSQLIKLKESFCRVKCPEQVVSSY